MSSFIRGSLIREFRLQVFLMNHESKKFETVLMGYSGACGGGGGGTDMKKNLIPKFGVRRPLIAA